MNPEAVRNLAALHRKYPDVAPDAPAKPDPPDAPLGPLGTVTLGLVRDGLERLAYIEQIAGVPTQDRNLIVGFRRDTATFAVGRILPAEGYFVLDYATGTPMSVRVALETLRDAPADWPLFALGSGDGGQARLVTDARLIAVEPGPNLDPDKPYSLLLVVGDLQDGVRRD